MNKETRTVSIGTDKYCFGLIRWSSGKQSKGDSLRRQMGIAPRVAKEKGWILRDDLCEVIAAASAYKGEHLERIRAIIDAAKSGKIPHGTVMIVEALDRLNRRDIDEATPLLWEILGSGLEIWIDHTSRHLTKDSLKNVSEMMMALMEMKGAHEYAATIAKRGGDGWKRIKARTAEGIIHTKMTPAWLEADKKTNQFTKLEDKVNLVTRMFTSYANGKGIRTIMREFNKEGIAPFGKGGQNKSRIWSSTHLRRTLTNRAVLGEYQPCNWINKKRVPAGDPVLTYYPAIIEPSLFYKVQGMLTEVINGRKGHASGPKGKVTNLFTRLLKCVHCGSAMNIKPSGTVRGKYSYTSLVCKNAAHGGGCKYATIRYDHVERAVLTLMFSKIVPAMIQSDTREEKLTTMKGELKEAQKQKTKWIEYADNAASIDDVAAQKINLWDTKQKALARQVQALEATIHDNPLVEWKHVEKTPENRLRLQSILANEVESLTIDAANRQAVLKVKRPEVSFTIGWPAGVGTNKTKANLADTLFWCEGNENPFPYLDTALVWKTEHSTTLEHLLEIAKPEKDCVMGSYMKFV